MAKDDWTSAEVIDFDRFLQVELGIEAALLMENAGAALARFCQEILTAHECRQILAICGPGNNGGDAAVALRHLAGSVPSHLWYPLGAPSEAATLGFKSMTAAVNAGVALKTGNTPPLPLDDDLLVIDALFGVGLSRPIDARSPAGKAIKTCNDSNAPVIAVDIPSGLDCDSGQIQGVSCRADYTMSFVAAKQGFSRGDGPTFCGKLKFADIGVSAELATEWLLRQRSQASRNSRQDC
jgi:NAD(P)H-hydrate epimerase